MKHKAIIKSVNKAFKDKEGYEKLCDALVNIFYPEYGGFRADDKTEDYEALFAQSSGSPSLKRRELAQSFSTMLRPTNKVWVEIRGRFDYGVKKDHQYKVELKAKSKELYFYMYDQRSNITTTTSSLDNALACLGQGVASVWFDVKKNHLTYIPHHLKEFAWRVDSAGDITTVYRSWKPEVHMLRTMFGENELKFSKETEDKIKDDDTMEIPVIHCVKKNPKFDSGTSKNEWLSIYIEKETGHELNSKELNYLPYIIPFWHRIPNKPYAYSPPAIVALPDSNLLQNVTASILDAGQLAVEPTIIAQSGVVLGGDNNVNVSAGQFLFVDEKYDERGGAAISTLKRDLNGLPYGFEIQEGLTNFIHEAFYLNKITLPAPVGQVTAYEIAQRVEEWVRNTLPLIEPISADYNYKLCKASLGALIGAGKMDMSEIPVDLDFTFTNPLTEGQEAGKMKILQDVLSILGIVAEVDEDQDAILDLETAVRDAVTSGEAPLEWFFDENATKEIIQNRRKEKADNAEMLKAQQAMELAKTGKDIMS